MAIAIEKGVRTNPTRCSWPSCTVCESGGGFSDPDVGDDSDDDYDREWNERAEEEGDFDEDDLNQD